MSEQKATCNLCGHPMPEGEEMFNYHGYSGPCPTPPLILPKVEGEMNDQERIELLKEVARVAPKEMKPRRWGPNITFFGVARVLGDNAKLDFSKSDGWNAQAVIAMLDAMEKAGYVVWTSFHVYCDDPENDRHDVVYRAKDEYLTNEIQIVL